jgi:hypothetical protein
MTVPGQLRRSNGEDASSKGTRAQVSHAHRERPRISVVAVCSEEIEHIRRILPLIEARAKRSDAELVIVCAGKWPESGVETEARTVVIQAPADATRAQLRVVGAQRASGDIVVLLDHLGSGVEQWLDRLPAPSTPPGEPTAGNEPDAQKARA